MASDAAMELDNPPTAADVLMSDETLPPLPISATLYIRNLSSRRSRRRLLNDLHALFIRYRPVDVHVPRDSIRMRGQAWVVFPDTRAASRAMKDLQGSTLARRPMLLQYARLPSTASVQAELAGGDKAAGAKRMKEHRRDRHVVRQAQTELFFKQRPNCRQGKRGRGKLGTVTETHDKDTAMSDAPQHARAPPPQQEKKPARTKVIATGDNNPPHRILFVQNLPEEATSDVLQAVFGRHSGFVEVRTVPGRAGMAFIEYERDEDAARAREATAGIALAGSQLRVTFGKKT